MVHEFAHLLTLRNGQITPLTPEEEEFGDPVECVVYATPECPTEDSYLTDYFTQFEYEDDAKYDPEVYPTEYAATIPTEDVAEVFAEWSQRPGHPHGHRRRGDPRRRSGQCSGPEVRLLESYPELAQVRADIQAGLAA